MTNKQLAEILRSTGSSLFDRTYDPDYKLLLDEAADRLENQGQWISVEERLPSEDERRDEYDELVPFLVCEKGTRYPYRAMYDGVDWGDGLMKIRGITHWMPLPEPPKTKGGE